MRGLVYVLSVPVRTVPTHRIEGQDHHDKPHPARRAGRRDRLARRHDPRRLIGALGREVADHEFATTASGYRAALAWRAGHGQVAVVGVKGTSSYGRGVTTALTVAGIRVVEVNRTRPAERRRSGKSDRLDAYRAARSVLSGEATTPPKDGSTEPLRALMVARRSALKAQQAACLDDSRR